MDENYLTSSGLLARKMVGRREKTSKAPTVVRLR